MIAVATNSRCLPICTVGCTVRSLPRFKGSDDASWLAGGQVGCQWQTGSWVLGIEGDFSATDISRDFIAVAPFPGPPAAPVFLTGDRLLFEHDWEASVRGRLGWAWDRFMVYATGGVAFANVEATFFPVGSPFAFKADDTLTGWTVGGGFEYAFTPNFSLGVEYRFSSYDTGDFNHGTVLVGAVDRAVTSAHDFETHQVTARLNWRFGSIFGW